MKNLILTALMATTGFAATINRDGVVGISKTFSAQTLHHGKLALGVNSHIVDDAEQIEGSTIDVNGVPVELKDYLILSSNLFMGIGLGPFTDIGLSLPLYFEKFSSTGGGLDLDHQYQGDLRYRLKVQLPFHDIQVMNLAIILGGSVPTQFDNRGVVPRELEYMTNDPAAFNKGSSPFGAGRPTFMAGLGMTLDFSQVAEKFQFLWHFNLGVRKTNISKDPPFEDVLFWSSAVEYEASSFIRFFGEFYHESRFKKLGDNEFSTDPTTISLGGVAQTPVGLDFYAGLVMGLNDGYIPVSYQFENTGSRHDFSIKGTPDLSMIFQVTWNGFILKQDNDLDGVNNKEDKCPDLAEDKDGFQDEDGCPDVDNDKDGINDAQDKCPLEPEDKDGFQDNDGCAEADNDKDGVPDLKDRCPNDAQGADGKEGCPNLDKDADGIVDMNDKCQNEAEDRDGYEDEDGCPDLDNDKDGIVDVKDKCPGAPETINKFEDEDGCPDKFEIKEVVKTMVLKGVNFKTGSAELTFESYRVLDDIVLQIQSSQDIQFEIAGHTDNRGNYTKNQMLSQSRAQSVANYFTNKGVDSKRLKVIGYGSSRPIGPNTSAEGRALNRRVELNRIN
ncbi:MAG: OmpA family protein [Fibrobacteria bacterium]